MLLNAVLSVKAEIMNKRIGCCCPLPEAHMVWQNPPCGCFVLRHRLPSKILLAKLARIVVCLELRGGLPCRIQRFSQD